LKNFGEKKVIFFKPNSGDLYALYDSKN